MSAPTITIPGTAGGGVPAGGSGVAGYVAKWTAATTLGGGATSGADASPFVDATGNLGIGTASPSALLHVNGNQIGGTGASVTPYAQALFGSSSSYTMWWKTDATAGGCIIGAAGPGLQFYVASGAPAGPTLTQVATFDATGNLGIGTTSPVSKLDVAGTITCDDTATGIKLPATPGNADVQTLDCYSEVNLSTGTMSGVTASAGLIIVAIRITRIGRSTAYAIRISPQGGASLTFAANWYLTLDGALTPAFPGAMAVSSNDATINRGSAWISDATPPSVYGSAQALGANVSLHINGIM